MDVIADWLTARRVRRLAIVASLAVDVIVVMRVAPMEVVRCTGGYSNRGYIIRWATFVVALFTGGALASISYGRRHDGLTTTKATVLSALVVIGAVASLVISWIELVNARALPCLD